MPNLHKNWYFKQSVHFFKLDVPDEINLDTGLSSNNNEK